MVGAVLAFIDAVVGGGLDVWDPISRFSLPIHLNKMKQGIAMVQTSKRLLVWFIHITSHLFLRKHTSPVRSTEVFRIFVAPESNSEIVLVFGNSCLRLSQTGSKNDGGSGRSKQMPFLCLPNIHCT